MHAWAFGVLMATGCTHSGLEPAETSALEGAERVELLALHPYRDEAPGERFHGFRVLGRASARAAARSRIAELVDRAASDAPGQMAKCFNPRHGVAVAGGGTEVDFVICFECFQMKVVRGGSERTVAIAAEPEDELDRLLAQHGLPKHTEAER